MGYWNFFFFFFLGGGGNMIFLGRKINKIE